MSIVEEQGSNASTSQEKVVIPKGDKNGNKASRGNRQDAPASIQLSKALSYILRHGAAKEHLVVRSDGYISLAAILARPKLSKLKMDHGGSPTVEDVLHVVESNDKKRFEVNQDGTQGMLIRAVQGHSISEVSGEGCFSGGVCTTY
jgi:2'-phosphotransferase